MQTGLPLDVSAVVPGPPVVARDVVLPSVGPPLLTLDPVPSFGRRVALPPWVTVCPLVWAYKLLPR